MFFFKACTKCQGDMCVDRDRYGTYVSCLQCGSLKEVKADESIVSHTNPQAAAELVTGRHGVLTRVA